jgi:hypothetical protein
MPKPISNLAFYLVSYNVIIFQILIAKFALSFAVLGVMHLIGKSEDLTYTLIGVVLIASIASIIIGILGYIKGTKMWIEKIKRIQTIKAVFVIIIMVLIVPPLSLITFAFLLSMGIPG